MAGIRASLLGCERVGTQESFFALGGHSLLVIQAVNRIRAHFGVALPVQRFFQEPTVAALARLVDASGDRPATGPVDDGPRVVRRERTARSRRSVGSAR
ncbi:phosphopantetheine-binding protein [Streptomyces sp. NPDC054904]|uniref:phosphopantetheine-binding protein n=1 Tax=Streptomyces sp. NPDC090054 TaxID=3365933 RepID=UPI00380D32A7